MPTALPLSPHPQVLYGPYMHTPPHLQQCAAQQLQHAQQQGAPTGMDCGWQAAASPRAPLAAVNGWQLSGGMQWEAAAGGASRKRGHDAAAGEHPSGGPGEWGWGRQTEVIVGSPVQLPAESTCREHLIRVASLHASSILGALPRNHTPGCQPPPATVQTPLSSGACSAATLAERPACNISSNSSKILAEEAARTLRCHLSGICSCMTALPFTATM